MNLKYFSIRNFYHFLSDLIRFRNLVIDLAKKDFKNRYLGSYLGIIWGFIQPVITILILWFVFQVGFKQMPVQNFPFILWLICAMIPWLFFSESLSGATSSILENAFLVKKVVFRVSVLPVVKILSALFVHSFFIILLFVFFAFFGYFPSIYNIQFIYYTFSAIVFVLGLSWITASLLVFIKDVGQIVSIILQFGFWLTPIFWTVDQIPGKYAFFMFIIKMNPVYYITDGYRQAFIHHTWFWQRPQMTLYFWIVTLLIWLLGTIIFKKLRPHFADVL